MDGKPLDREGMPIDAVIDPASGFITKTEPDGTNTTFGPNGMKLPDASILPPSLTVAADGVPRNASGVLHFYSRQHLVSLGTIGHSACLSVKRYA